MAVNIATTSDGPRFSPLHTAQASTQLEGLHRFLASRPIEMIDAGEAIVHEGTRSHHLYEVVSGCVRRIIIAPDGRRSVIDFLFAGDFFGDLFGGEHSLTAEAVTDLEIRRISRAHFNSGRGNFPQLEIDLMALMWHDLSAAQRHVVVLGAKTARARVAMFLLAAAKWPSISDQNQKPAREIELPMGRLDIADFLGLTIESVSRVLTQFKLAGIITVNGSLGHKVVLKNVPALQRLAGEEQELAA